MYITVKRLEKIPTLTRTISNGKFIRMGLNPAVAYFFLGYQSKSAQDHGGMVFLKKLLKENHVIHTVNGFI